MDINKLIIILPFVGATLIGLGGFLSKGFRIQEKVIGYLATAMVAIPFFIVLKAFLTFNGEPITIELFDWMKAGNLHLSFSYKLDQLSLLMGMIVTGIGSLIHLYSSGYMHGDSGYYKFFLYLNLFIFSMLNLVLGDNLIVTFLGWEGVGACSYFLIGFWFTDMEKAKAAQKAFVANRIGDFAFLVGVFIIYMKLSALGGEVTLKYDSFAALKGDPSIFWVALLFFVAATGKSAQIPLYVWLPDAMAGPTPVSALIHAATMVTSGIYLIARTSPTIYSQPEAAPVLIVIAIVAGTTALVSALIAISQNDIKKVLAYSTVSQLGFMFMALGAGAFTTAIFHVMTHAFFKACLFLGSGSVIHAMDHTHSVEDPQDIRTMGGLGKYMPSTSKTFWIATIAIAGIPGLSGFFSKDEILGSLFAAGMDHNHGNAIYFVVWGMGCLTAFLTAFYMTRVTFLTFNGKQRFGPDASGHMAKGHGQGHDDHGHAHGGHGHSHHYHAPHESPWTMTLPLWVLGILSVVGGYLGLPAIINHGHSSWIHGWLDGFNAANDAAHGAAAHGGGHFPIQLAAIHYHLPMGIEIGLIAFSIAIASIGMFVAYNLYKKHDLAGDEKVKKLFGGLYPAMQNKFYVDEFYNKAIIRPFVYISEFFVVPFDKFVVDGAVNGAGGVTDMLGGILRKLQSGLVANYALLMMIGVVVMLAYLIF